MLFHIKIIVIKMSIRITLFITAALLLGLNGYLYANSQGLKKDIADAAEQCDGWLANLSQRQNKPSLQKVKVINAHEDEPAVAAEPAEEVVLEKLVSHRHKVQAVNHKYEFLLLSAQVDESERKLLKRLLVKREQLADAIYQAEMQGTAGFAQLEEQLYEVEDQIELVLSDPLDYERYHEFKEQQL
ncbi:hypothetical protein SAMN02745866_00747 [Alteromonadaceae bacterium Bs31]|nr:hypothetical protein SAMN02745866_00747 [Alteromonadaceae bacterium Bs31]